jgi:hypothetical protein
MAEQRVESEGHFEMLWDCDHCDTKGLLGLSQRFCPECGGPQNPVKRYFPKEGEQRRVDGHKYQGADRECPNCNTPMSALGKNCTQCGAPMDGSREVQGVAAPVTAAPPNKHRRWWLVAVIVGVIALGIFGIWYRFIRTVTAQKAVSGHHWAREIAIEEFGEIRDSQWRDQMPRDAEAPSCFRKERSTRQVDTGKENCHTERKDKKDGTFEQIKKCTPIYRSEPVEDDWCTFSVRRWKQVDTAKTTGTGMSPAWSTANLPAADTRAAFGARRQGKKTETLFLDFGGESCDVSDAVWRKYTDGRKVKIEVRASSGDIVCSSL